jgi:hypothetical protein
MHWRSDLWTRESIQIFHGVNKRISENRWNSEMEKRTEAPFELLGQGVPMTTKFVVLVTCVIYER